MTVEFTSSVWTDAGVGNEDQQWGSISTAWQAHTHRRTHTQQLAADWEWTNREKMSTSDCHRLFYVVMSYILQQLLLRCFHSDWSMLESEGARDGLPLVNAAQAFCWRKERGHVPAAGAAREPRRVARLLPCRWMDGCVMCFSCHVKSCHELSTLSLCPPSSSSFCSSLS